MYINQRSFILLLFLILFVPSAFTFAYDPGYPGSLVNPLQVQIVPDPAQIHQQQIRDMESRLQQRSQENYQNIIIQQQRDLQNQLLQQQLDARLPSNIRANRSITCQSGFVLNTGRTGCVRIPTPPTLTVTCPTGYTCTPGASPGNPATGCPAGYFCTPVAPPKTNDQVCQGNYGTGSKWDSFDNRGALICDCETGYQWNQGQTQCILIPKKTEVVIPPVIMPKTEKKTETPAIKEVVVKENTTQNEMRKYATTSISDLPSVNKDRVLATTTETRRTKSFWTKAWEWLGL